MTIKPRVIKARCKDMGQGVASAGIEYYLPLFFDATATVFDYLGDAPTLVLHGDLEQAMSAFWQDAQDRYRLAQGDPERPALAPQHLFLSIEQFYGLAKPHAQFSMRGGDPDKGPGPWALPWPDVHADRGTEDPLERLKLHLAQRAERVLVLAESEFVVSARAIGAGGAAHHDIAARCARRPKIRKPLPRVAARGFT